MPPLIERLPLNALQKGIYARLTDGTFGVEQYFADIGGRIYDEVPELDENGGVEYPYLEFGAFQSSEEGNKSRNVKSFIGVFHCLSAKSGNLECNSLMDATLRSLTQDPKLFSLDSPWQMAQVRYDSAEIFKDFDGPDDRPFLIRHGVLRVAFIVSQTS